MATPVFIVGAPRSGTTWLANMLGRHSQVACVRQGTPGEDGAVNESGFFSHVAGKFGDLREPNNLIQMIEVFGASTFFILSGLDKALLYRRRPAGDAAFFRAVMEALAERDGRRLWLEKTPSNTFHMDEIAAAYPDAKFVATVREDIVAQIASYLRIEEIRLGVKWRSLGARARAQILAVRVFKYHAHVKHVAAFRRKDPARVWYTSYEGLCRETEARMAGLAAFLGVEVEPGMFYRRQPDPEGASARAEVLGPLDVRIIRGLSPLMGLLPFAVYRMMYRLGRHSRRREFPYWLFSYNIEKYGWASVFGEGHQRVARDG